jgi:L-alanine-DL-glutamate epimerase-like enolase superfamily enzyme
MKIIATEVNPVSQVVRPEVAIISAGGAQPESHYAVVKVRTEGGHVGFGEASVRNDGFDSCFCRNDWRCHSCSPPS